VTETWAATTFGAMQVVMKRTYREMYGPRRAAAPLPAMGSMGIVPVNEAGDDDDAFNVTLGDGGQYLVEFRLTGPDEELDGDSDLGDLLQFAANVNEQQEEIPEVIEVVLSDPEEESSPPRNTFNTLQQPDSTMANAVDEPPQEEQSKEKPEALMDTNALEKTKQGAQDNQLPTNNSASEANPLAPAHDSPVLRRTIRRVTIETTVEEYVAPSPTTIRSEHRERLHRRTRRAPAQDRRHSRSPSVEENQSCVGLG
jgi:hypothetical protein